MTVTFCGHSELAQTLELVSALKKTVMSLIQEGADEFLLGGYGAFDRLAARIVWDIKTVHPEIHSHLVLAYIDRKVDAKDYDNTIYPPLETVPRKYAIVHRNQWMVENADVVIAYVNHGWGGAASTFSYAKAKRKRIIQLGEYLL